MTSGWRGGRRRCRLVLAVPLLVLVTLLGQHNHGARHVGVGRRMVGENPRDVEPEGVVAIGWDGAVKAILGVLDDGVDDVVKVFPGDRVARDDGGRGGGAVEAPADGDVVGLNLAEGAEKAQQEKPKTGGLHVDGE